MQLASSASWKAVLAFAAVGLVAGFAAMSFTTPQYSSHAVVSLVPAQDAPKGNMVDTINRYSMEILSRSELVMVIRNLDLYKTERNSMTLEDVIEGMKKNIRIRAVEAAVNGQNLPAFEVDFTYNDPATSQKVVNYLVSRYLDTHVKTQDREAYLAGRPPERAPTMRVIDPASLPVNPVWPRKTWYAFAGLAAGALVGCLAAWILARRRSRASEVEPTRSPNLARRILLGASLAGLAIGLAFPLFLTPQYDSRGVLALLPPAGVTPILNPETIQRYSRELFAGPELANLVRDLDLYRKPRASRPMEQIVELMRQNISVRQIRLLTGGREAPGFEVTFTYEDRFAAQRVVNTLLSRFVEAHMKSANPDALRTGQPLPESLAVMKVIAQATASEDPIFPKRETFALAGPGGGSLFAGLSGLFLFARRKRQPA